MVRSNNGVAARRFWRPSRWSVTVASATAMAVGLSLASGVGAASATTPGQGPNPAATRAALDPSLVQGRGATVDFAEQEAETSATDGSVVAPGTAAYTLAAEASGRSAVT